MSLILSEVYDALIEAGASETKAREAATAIASYENRLTNLAHKIDRLATELRIYSGILSVLIVGVLWKVFR